MVSSLKSGAEMSIVFVCMFETITLRNIFLQMVLYFYIYLLSTYSVQNLDKINIFTKDTCHSSVYTG